MAVISAAVVSTVGRLVRGFSTEQESTADPAEVALLKVSARIFDAAWLFRDSLMVSVEPFTS
ncbi:hypothetical protein IFR05_017202 [Cadophora sp. M221]|nr:hypothetical protein IFR05_017202 [Cadophora sp. M221]